MRLTLIIRHFNRHKALPESLDCTGLFSIYKSEPRDITPDFFEERAGAIEYTTPINFDKNSQFTPYRDFEFIALRPFLDRYFTPSDEIRLIESAVIAKYGIDPEKTIGLYYRGTDKRRETSLGKFEIFLERLRTLKATGFKVLVQTDSAPFQDFMRKNQPDICVINENRVSYTHKGIHLESSGTENYHAAKQFLATLLILSKCKYLICNSGNCSTWMALYRGHGENLHQLLKDVWV